MARKIEIEFHLDATDAWRSGDKATPGQPATGENYALTMRYEIKRHYQALLALGHPIPATELRAVGL